MKQDFDTLLDKLATSTRSPRGRYSSANSWTQLEARLFGRSGRPMLWVRTASAAAAMLLCLLGWFTYDYLSPATLQTVSTMAETCTVVLPDHTEVVLNRYSTLTYPQRFKGKRREVKLQGEAYFEVTPNTAQPFVVQAEKMSIQVLGTHFNVEAYARDAEIRTTLLEGAVAVSINEGGQRLVLAPNQTAIYNKVKQTLEQQRTPDAASEIVWSNNILCFDRQPLHEIARQLTNAFDTPIRIDDALLRNFRITASFQNKENLTQILDLLQGVGNFTYTQVNDTILITKLN